MHSFSALVAVLLVLGHCSAIRLGEMAVLDSESEGAICGKMEQTFDQAYVNNREKSRKLLNKKCKRCNEKCDKEQTQQACDAVTNYCTPRCDASTAPANGGAETGSMRRDEERPLENERPFFARRSRVSSGAGSP